MVLVDLAVEQRIVFKIIHVSLAYVGHRMNLYFDLCDPTMLRMPEKRFYGASEVVWVYPENLVT